MIELLRAFNFEALERFNAAFVEATKLPRFSGTDLKVRIEPYQDSLIYTTDAFNIQLRATQDGVVVLTCSGSKFDKLHVYKLRLNVLLEKQDYIIHFVNFLVDGTLPPTEE